MRRLWQGRARQAPGTPGTGVWGLKLSATGPGGTQNRMCATQSRGQELQAKVHCQVPGDNMGLS